MALEVWSGCETLIQNNGDIPTRNVRLEGVENGDEWNGLSGDGWRFSGQRGARGDGGWGYQCMKPKLFGIRESATTGVDSREGFGDPGTRWCCGTARGPVP